MKTELLSLSKIFTERLFRIPDFQRGYAWTQQQIDDFWYDLISLENGKSHYVGVITLEDVRKNIYDKWEDDIWLINSKSYTPYYIIDGQQRLTTIVILVRAIIHTMSEKNIDDLNYDTQNEIKKKYIVDTKDSGISKTYIFGYEKDNPSYHFLKFSIFGEDNNTSESLQDTIYTSNLFSAYDFFKSKLKDMSQEDIQVIYKKITQNFLFNIYSIAEEIDTFVAFETMNNRGKKLSHLELLKNRLIYLSTKLNSDNSCNADKDALRRNINEAWKSIYHFLGKNKKNRIEDDDFLSIHFKLYFEPKTIKNNRYSYHNRDYKDYLLNEFFSSKNKIINGCSNNSSDIKIETINKYVESIKKSIELFHNIKNPDKSNYTPEIKDYLEKIIRLNDCKKYAYYNQYNSLPLMIAFFEKNRDTKKQIEFLKKLERYLFIYNIDRFYFDTDDEDSLDNLSHRLFNGKMTCDQVIKAIQNPKKIEDITTQNPKKIEGITTLFRRLKDNGYYEWGAIYYFLYEYEISLLKESKTHTHKLNWSDFNTIEHIYPKNAKKNDWYKFCEFTPKDRKSLRDSLGNLLPSSREKNASLNNASFEVKKNGRNKNSITGYKYGCFSEMQVAKYDDWTYEQIIERGIKLLEFLEKRWEIPLGDKKNKAELLGLKNIPLKE